MSISEQVKELRELASIPGIDAGGLYDLNNKLYQAAETIEALSAKLETANKELERWHTDKINDKIKNPFAWTSTLCCHNCDHKDEYIEELEAADMERSAEDCGDGWIQCKDRLPETSEYMGFAPTPYMKRIEIAYMTDTVEYLIGFYDGSKWMDKHLNIIKNVIAWKPFLKLPEDYHEPQQIHHPRQITPQAITGSERDRKDRGK